jgi:hypothetical protein
LFLYLRFLFLLPYGLFFSIFHFILYSSLFNFSFVLLFPHSICSCFLLLFFSFSLLPFYFRTIAFYTAMPTTTKSFFRFVFIQRKLHPFGAICLSGWKVTLFFFFFFDWTSFFFYLLAPNFFWCYCWKFFNLFPLLLFPLFLLLLLYSFFVLTSLLIFVYTLCNLYWYYFLFYHFHANPPIPNFHNRSRTITVFSDTVAIVDICNADTINGFHVPASYKQSK